MESKQFAKIMSKKYNCKIDIEMVNGYLAYIIDGVFVSYVDESFGYIEDDIKFVVNMDKEV